MRFVSPKEGITRVGEALIDSCPLSNGGITRNIPCFFRKGMSLGEEAFFIFNRLLFYKIGT